ncbi:hypothetical protein KI809_16955 [Geobacter pelophilus]|uniref:DUF2345 domain-containing protein n=1 Tax=Geoanaerobacter pelophilus TaxID=60036 RepID=A0AAW4L4V1_9BACT|nr:hypothetical protein [Geoanaerobacter pelophilus]MBT0666003.1 hypothetical protein [Geoanaerobacter pelophilus]
MQIRNSTGHIVTLDDSAMTIAIGDDQGDAIVFDARNRTLTVDVQQGVAITVTGGNVTINAPHGVTIKSDTTRIEGDNITLQGKNVTVTGDTVTLGAAAAAALVKESLIDIFNDHQHRDQYGVFTAKPNLTGTKGVHSTTKARGA